MLDFADTVEAVDVSVLGGNIGICMEGADMTGGAGAANVGAANDGIVCFLDRHFNKILSMQLFENERKIRIRKRICQFGCVNSTCTGTVL